MNKNNKITIFSHVLVWFVLFSMPYLLSYGQTQDINRVIAHFWVPLILSSVIFYLNYFLLIDRYLFSKKMILFILVNSAIIISCLFLKELIEVAFFQNMLRKKIAVNGGRSGPPFMMFFYIQTLSYMAPLLFSIAIKSTKRWVKTEAERTEAANVKLQSELQHLHYQLQPHFFFNSLNNIYALVDISPDQAKASIHSLGKLMRYMLYEANVELTPLVKEVDFMKKYIDLMKLRVSDKTSVHCSFPSVDAGVQIAPLLFISLIENAFKHGVSANQKSSIELTMTLEGKVVFFTIENDDFPKQGSDKSGSGIGLPNIKKRLELLYPNKHHFGTKVDNNRFIATIEIDIT